MKNILRGVAVAAAALFLSVPGLRAQSSTGTTNLQVTVGAEAALTVGASTSLTSAGTNFSSYTGTTSLTYFIRTTLSGGTGSITLKVTSDFPASLAGGPSVAAPPTAGDALTYTSTGSNPGNNGTATFFAAQPASTTAQTNVVTFGADNRSLVTGNATSVAWTLTNDPKYKTGSYSATVTFTISAT